MARTSARRRARPERRPAFGLSADGGSFLGLLLWLTVVLPALAIAWGERDGQLTFLLYREPKLIAGALLGWPLLLLLTWRWRSPSPADELATLLRRPPLTALALLVAYLSASGLWATVRENHFYELQQLLLWGALLLLLLLVGARRPVLRSAAYSGLLWSAGILTVVGLLQAAGVLPWLRPIDPEVGARHPSLMGYKNPAALVIVGQLFLLLGRIVDRTRPTVQRLATALLAALELGYVVSLGSRTSYLALAAGSVLTIGASMTRLRGAERRASLAVTTAAMLLGTLALFALPRARERALSLVRLTARPAEALATDRAAYARDTLHMALDHPFGVGFGDWQTQYPLYRRFHRELTFGRRVQVRRAHSDHVQMLGEGGFVGLAIWLAFLALLVRGAWPSYAAREDRSALWVSAQLIALVTAMSTDYVWEHPYLKQQLFLVAFLALVGCGRSTAAAPNTRRLPGLVLIAVAVVVVGQLAYHVQLARRTHLGAQMQWLAHRADSRSAANEIVRLGSRAERLRGHTKTLYRDWLVLSAAARRLGDDATARSAAWHAWRLHPYSLDTLEQMMRVSRGADKRRWRAARRFVAHDAVEGPAGPLLALPAAPR